MMVVFKCIHKTKTTFHVLPANLAKNLPVSPRAHQELSCFCPHSLFLSSSKYSRNNVCAKTQWLFLANLSGHPALCFSFSFLFSFVVCCYAPQMRSNPAAMTTELFRGSQKLAARLLTCSLQEDTELLQTNFKNLTSPVALPLVLVTVGIHGPAWSLSGSLLFLFCAEEQVLQSSCRECSNFIFHSALPHLPLWRPQKGLREQPVAVWTHRQRGEQLSIALQISVPN